MYFQLVDNQVLSTQGQPDVFNLHRLTAARVGFGPHWVKLHRLALGTGGLIDELDYRYSWVQWDLVFNGTR